MKNVLENTDISSLTEKLKKSEMRYRRLFETAKDGILILDFDTGKIADANPYIADIIGLPQHEIIGKELWEIGLFSNKKQSQKAFAELKNNGYIRFEDMPVKNQLGQLKEVEFISNVYLVGKTKVIQCNIREITQRKREEKKQELIISILSILNARLEWKPLIKDILVEIRNFTGTEAVGIRLKDGDEFPYYETNDLQTSFISPDQQNFTKSKTTEIIGGKETKPLLECICNNVISGCTDPSLPYFTKGGSFFTGNTDLLINYTTQQKASTFTCFICNTNGYKSVAFIPLHVGKEIIGLLQIFDKSIDRFTEDMIEFFEKIGTSIGIAFNRVQNELRIKENELCLKNKNIEYIKLNKEYLTVNEELTESLKNINRINGILTLSKSKAEESDRLKSSFLANMSHEIRTPMNAIIGFADLLLENGLSKEKNKEYVHIINASGQQLLSVINDVLDMSRIETGQITIDIGLVNIDELLNELFVIYKKLTEPKKLKLLCSCENRGRNILIKTDGNKIKQIICNLLNNAIKFTEKGDIHFGYYMNENLITFYVKDTGIGMAQENYELIFERFSQIAPSDDRIYGGNGLGLSISKALVGKLGGTISVDSELGVGSTFNVTIPHVPDDEKAIHSNLNYKHDRFFNWDEKTILIVEDDKYNHAYIEEILLPTNIKIKHAWNGSEAVEHMKKHHDVSLMLMDINMPIMDGYKAMQRIKQLKLNVPIIAITAYAQDHDRKKALESGFDYYMAKPVSRNQLLEVIENHLQ